MFRSSGEKHYSFVLIASDEQEGNWLRIVKLLLMFRMIIKESSESWRCSVLQYMEVTYPTSAVAETVAYAFLKCGTDDKGVHNLSTVTFLLKNEDSTVREWIRIEFFQTL